MKTDALTTACANELRATIEDFVGNTHDDDALVRARELLAEVRQALAGPAAPRYYERMGTGDRDPAAAFRDYLNETPLGGGNNPVSPSGTLELHPDPARPAVTGTVNAGRVFEGPAKCLHGGLVAGLFDHFLGMSQHAYGLAHGTPLMAATKELTVRFLAPTPLDTDLRFEAWCEDVDERTLHGHGTCHAGDKLTATAEGIFINLGAARMLSKDGFQGRP